MRRQKGKFRETVESIALALLVALFVRTFFLQAFKIPSSSMEPTLLVGDHILVNKFIYGIRIPWIGVRFLDFYRPKRGDVIVFIYPRNPKKDFIKRVIAVGGEKVYIKGTTVYVDDRPIKDPWGVWKREGERPEFGPVVVPKDHLFVLGDNRDNSMDSRYWGFVPMRDVLGKAFVIYWSWNGRAKGLLEKVRWSRIGRLIR
ncbi:MAG: signal peptidase I [Deltaproteobacteria bacterium]|nr:MAG: signal peptidase I [Deltaproteobacteria bacterium]RLB02569.1 MAG: signal peptidase I [Deltaproteobacteria bacterium]